MVNPSPEQEARAIAAHIQLILGRFMSNTIRLDVRQLLAQIESLGESRSEADNEDERASIDRCIAFVNATGMLKYGRAWVAAHHAHFVGEG